MINEYSCYRCKRTREKIAQDNPEEKIALVSVHAPGMYFICPNCIDDIENETRKVAIYHPMQGISFHSKEKAKELLDASDS